MQQCMMLIVLMAMTCTVVYASKRLARAFAMAVSRSSLVRVRVRENALKNINKFSEQSWQLAVHLGFGIVEGFVLWDNGFAWLKPENCMKFYAPSAPSDLEPTAYVSPSGASCVRLVYVGQLAVWFYTAFSHRFVEERRKDYFVMFVHHVVTLVLLVASMQAGALRFGIVVLFLHDVSDVAVDLLKMANYLGADDRSGLFLSETFYIATMLSWGYCRFWLFAPLWTSLLPGSFDSLWLQKGGFDMPAGMGALSAPQWFGVFLFMLQAMHVWWYLLLARIGLAVFFVEKGKDLTDIGEEHYEAGSASSAVAARRRKVA
jgi:ceramide synthetase